MSMENTRLKSNLELIEFWF